MDDTTGKSESGGGGNANHGRKIMTVDAEQNIDSRGLVAVHVALGYVWMG